MPSQLIVILGAGASYDCATPSNVRALRRRPPLTKDLFASDHRDVLDSYPLAQAVAADLQLHLSDGAVALEAYLRDELLNSEHEHHRAQYWSVPLYLQDLLQHASEEYTTHADNYDRLLSALLRLDSTIFVTLNYDTIFDRTFAKYRPLESLDDYVFNFKVGLVKLHGSTNWGRQLLLKDWKLPQPDHRYHALCFGLATDAYTLSERIDLTASPAENRSAQQLRFSSDGAFLYPALAAPLGSEDELVCPPAHTDYLKSRLDQQAVGYGLHLLIVGYSCLDQRLLELIRDSGNRIQSVVIVNGNEASGEEVYARLLEYLQGACARRDIPDDFVNVFPGGFSDYTTSGQLLGQLVDRVGAASSN